MEGLEGLSPELIQQLVDLGALEGENAMLAEEMLAAAKMQNAPGPQGRQAGNVFVAANPLEHVSSALRQYKGGQQMKDVRGRQQGVLDKQSAGRGAYAQQLIDMLRGTPATAPQDPMTPRKGYSGLHRPY